MRRLTGLLLVLLLAGYRTAEAQQQLSDAEKATRLQSAWTTLFEEVRKERGFVVNAGAIAGPGNVPLPPETKRLFYQEVIDRLVRAPQLQAFYVADPALIGQMTPPDEALLVQKLAETGVADKGAKSVNASATNPAAAKVAERSGFTDLMALALDAKQFVASDKTAVSINLNAVALLGLNSETESAQAAYRKHGALRRVGGTFTFGAKIPEGELTGLTGLPSADDLLDTVSWDVKVRVIGDRDPRARRWYNEMLGHLGGLAEILANVGETAIKTVPNDMALVVQPVLSDLLGAESRRVKDEVSHSLQVSVKAAGQHLASQTGKNKYSFAVLGDQGFGDTDFTFNLLYSAVNDVSLAPNSLFTVKTFTGTVALNTLVAKNAIVKGRSTELSFNANFDVPIDKESLPVERKALWRAVGAVTLPWGDSAKIPISITYTNDPNKLTKEKFVSGNIGVSYDFGALKSLFK